MEADYKKIFGRATLMQWIVLLVCYCMSVVRPDLFLLPVQNSRVLMLSDWIESHVIAYYLVATTANLLASGWYVLTCLGRRWFESKTDLIIFIATVMFGNVVKLISPIAGFIYDVCWQFTGLPVVLGGKLRRSVFYIVSMNFFQIFTLLARSLSVEIAPTTSTISMLVLSIDTYLYLLLMYIYSAMGGDLYGIVVRYFSIRRCNRTRSDEEGNSRKGFQRNKLREVCRTARQVCSDCSRNWQARSKVSKKVMLQFYGRRIRGYIIFFGVLSTVAFFQFRVVETLLMFACYLGLRWTYPKTFHTKPIPCIILSLVLFVFIVTTSPSVSNSLTLFVVTGLAIGYALWKTQDYSDLLHGDDNKIKLLVDKCYKSGLSKQMTSIAIDCIVNGLTNQEIADKYGIEYQTARNYRHKINKTIK